MCTRLSVHMLQMHMRGVSRGWVETDARGHLPELGRSAGARSSALEFCILWSAVARAAIGLQFQWVCTAS